MGQLIDGQWYDVWYDTAAHRGRFVRQSSQFRHWITKDGQAGPTGTDGFKAEPDRYHLIVSDACPWAHRTLILRALKKLEVMIGVTSVHYLMAEHGWTLRPESSSPFDMDYLHTLYTQVDPHYSGRVTVPVLWDTHRQTIVSNESADIIRMLNQSFNHLGAAAYNSVPEQWQDQIDAWNTKIYSAVNNGVYRCGFASTQSAYDEAATLLFATLDAIDQHLADVDFLVGFQPTEADWRLFTTLYRFDAVYVTHFKCARKRLSDYLNLWPYARRLYQWPGVAKTCKMDQIQKHYYHSHTQLNPHQIIPDLDLSGWDAPVERV